MVQTMMSNPYTAPPSMRAEPEPRIARGITAAVWCGIVSLLAIGIPCLCALVISFWRLFSMNQSFGDSVRLMNLDMTPEMFLLAVLPFPLAFGIYKRSRICAAVVVLALLAITAWDGIHGNLGWDWTTGVSAIFITTSSLGMIGTILHHRRKAAVYSA